MMRRRKPEQPNSFMSYVQLHERSWGTERYSGKPSLAEILEAPVVVFWQVEDKKDRLTVTLHDDLGDVEKFLTRMLFAASVNTPRKKPARIYQNQKRMAIRGVKILFAPANDD